MANKYNYRSGPKEVRRVPVASGTVIEIGELLKLSSGRAAKMATSTDNLTFIGVAEEAHAATDPSGSISVAAPNAQTVYEYDLNAATDVVVGAAYQWNADKTLKASTTDPIATAVRSELAASTALVVFRLSAVSSSLGEVGDAS
jgi:hypothetical protein